MPSATFECTKPGDMEFTLSMTMPMKNWRELSAQLSQNGESGKWPASDLNRAIRGVIHQAEKVYFANATAAASPVGERGEI